MGIITHIIDDIPSSLDESVLQKQEDKLLTTPSPRGPFKLWDEYPLLSVSHFAAEWQPSKFAPPKDVYKGPTLRLEWQQMDGRQPFYHRNADVDEISYQVSGDRTLITDVGTTELRPGDFSRIPVSVAHDNYGRKEVHLLFYIPAPVEETGQVVSTAEIKDIPFEGWTANENAIELMTSCLGDRECDVAVACCDEVRLLDGKSSKHPSHSSKINVQRAVSKSHEIEWMYKSNKVWLGDVNMENEKGRVYRTHRRATVIQYQKFGARTLVTQRGTIELHPGDFVQIPLGCAYTSICKGKSSHISILTFDHAELKADVTRIAEPTVVDKLASLRDNM